MRTAAAVSVLWHLFWFFSVQVTVKAPNQPTRAKPPIVALGAVLDDTIFRTLVETKPQLSETFYRRLTDFAAPVEVAVRTLPRYAPGDVVSLKVQKKSVSLFRQIVGGDKAVPDIDWSARLPVAGETPPDDEEERRKWLLRQKASTEESAEGEA